MSERSDYIYNVLSNEKLLESNLNKLLRDKYGVSRQAAWKCIRGFREKGLLSRNQFTRELSVNHKAWAERTEVDTITTMTDLHAFQVHYLMYATSYSRVEGTLTSLDIPFKVTGNKAHPFYNLAWHSIKLQIGSKQIVACGPKRSAPINVEGKVLLEGALKSNIEAVSDFLAKTHIRCQETVDGRLCVKVKYYELALTNNDLAKKVTENGGFIPLAYDRATGKASIWADHTPNPASLETNKLKNHEVLRPWAQGIEDGVIKPYEDEMRHRQEINEILSLMHQQADLGLKNEEKLNYYADNVAAHSEAIEKLNRVLEKLDKKL